MDKIKKTNKTHSTAIALLLMLCGGRMHGQDNIVYPKAFQSDQSYTIWGKDVKDPYSWMEDFKSPSVTAWVNAEQNFSKKYYGDTYLLGKYIEYYSSIRFQPLFRRGDILLQLYRQSV